MIVKEKKIILFCREKFKKCCNLYFDHSLSLIQTTLYLNFFSHLFIDYIIDNKLQ